MELLALDIDGVMNNYFEVILKLLRKEYNKKLSETTYDLFKALNFTNAEKTQFLAANQNYIQKHLKVNENCAEIINYLSNKYQITIITARKYDLAEATIKWLSDNNIVYHNIYFAAGDKVDICKWLNPRYIVEDSPWNIKKLNRNNIPCIIYDQPYNQNIHESVSTIRVADWNELYISI